MKFEGEDVIDVVKQVIAANNLPPEIIRDVSAKLNQKAREIEQEKDAEDKAPRKKTQYVLVTDQKNIDTAAVNEMEFFIVKINEDYDHDQVPLNLFSAANYFNQNDKKAKKKPIQSLVDAFATLKKKHFNVTPEENTPKIVTKIPCIVVGAQLGKKTEEQE